MQTCRVIEPKDLELVKYSGEGLVRSLFLMYFFIILFSSLWLRFGPDPGPSPGP